MGYEWIVLGIAFLIDLASHGGTYYQQPDPNSKLIRSYHPDC